MSVESYAPMLVSVDEIFRNRTSKWDFKGQYSSKDKKKWKNSMQSIHSGCIYNDVPSVQKISCMTCTFHMVIVFANICICGINTPENSGALNDLCDYLCFGLVPVQSGLI